MAAERSLSHHDTVAGNRQYGTIITNFALSKSCFSILRCYTCTKSMENGSSMDEKSCCIVVIVNLLLATVHKGEPRIRCLGLVSMLNVEFALAMAAVRTRQVSAGCNKTVVTSAVTGAGGSASASADSSVTMASGFMQLRSGLESLLVLQASILFEFEGSSALVVREASPPLAAVVLL